MILPVLLTLAVTTKADPVRVVTSTLDAADWVQQIGGDRVEVHAITKGRYDLHYYEPRPSEVMKLNRADLVVVAGMELDAYMTGLLDAARNAKIRFGQPGFVDPSRGIKPLKVPTGRIDGSHGDVHPYGNPHFWFTPDNVEVACRNIAKGLIRVDPKGEAVYRSGLEQYLEQVRATFRRLQADMAPLKGTKVLQYHESWDYFCETFGLEIAGSIEPKPGIPPSAAYLVKLVQHIREESIPLALVEIYYPEKPLRFLERETEIQALRLALLLGGDKEPRNYLENLSAIVEQITGAMGGDS